MCRIRPTRPGKARTKKGAPKAKKTAKKATNATLPSEFWKKEVILEMLRGNAGATLDEIIEASGWQRHACRGSVSSAGKSFNIASEKTDAGRRHRIAAKLIHARTGAA